LLQKVLNAKGQVLGLSETLPGGEIGRLLPLGAPEVEVLLRCLMALLLIPLPQQAIAGTRSKAYPVEGVQPIPHFLGSLLGFPNTLRGIGPPLAVAFLLQGTE
jgi:hypothetical protein